MSKKFDLELKLLDHKIAKNEQTIANLLDSTIKNAFSSNETPVMGKQMENGIKMLNEKVNTQDNLNREGFANMDIRIKDLESITYNYSVKDGTLLDLVDNKKIEEKFKEERDFVVEELRKNGKMMHFHDILWRFMLAFYTGYSRDHNAEGPSFCNKNTQEQMLQHALEYMWRAPLKEISKFISFPALPINQGFEQDRVNDQSNVNRHDYNVSFLNSLLNADKVHHDPTISKQFMRPFLFEFGL